MRDIENYKEYGGKGHQPDYDLITLEINIIGIWLANHACSFIIIMIRAVNLIIVCEKISIRWLLQLLFDLVTTLSIFRKSFDQVNKEATIDLFAFVSLSLYIICIILF